MLRTLHGRLTLAFFGLLLLLAAAGLIVTLRGSRLYAREVQQKLHHGLAEHVVSHQSLLAGGEIDQTGLKDLFHSLMVINPDIELYLLDAQGEILAFDAPPGRVKAQSVSLDPVRGFLAEDAKLPLRGDDPRHPGEKKIFSAAPIVEDGQVSGYLYIILAGEEQAFVAQMVGESYILRSTLLLVLVAAALAMVVGVFLFRHLTRRLRHLSDRMEEFETSVLIQEEGRPTTKRPDGGDELDRLTHAFEKMAARIRVQIEELKEMDRLRRELVANVSHDLRTPLTHLEGYLETLLLKKDSLSDTERREYIEIALQQSKRLDRLVTDLLELARLEARQIPIEREVFSAAELVHDVVQHFSLQARQQGVQLKAEVAPELASVDANLGLIERVLQNLLENALRHTPEGGEITVSLGQSDGRVKIAVRDTGEGIPAEIQEQIYDRFWRRRHGTESGGLGLGLAIARQALALHDSGLLCDSAPGQGTTFQFELSPPGAAL